MTNMTNCIEQKIDTQRKERLLDLTSRNIDVGQVAQEKLVRGEGAIHLMAERKYYSTLQKVYAAPNLAADI